MISTIGTAEAKRSHDDPRFRFFAAHESLDLCPTRKERDDRNNVLFVCNSSAASESTSAARKATPGAEEIHARERTLVHPGIESAMNTNPSSAK